MRLAYLLVLVISSASFAAEPLLQLDLPGRRVQGLPLAWSEQTIFLLARDGQLIEFPPAQATNPLQLSPTFTSFSQAEIRGQLLREFGQGYEVSGVGHYLVVHPAAADGRWAPRFEELYRSFLHYFAARGWRLSEPQFPLIAVVYPRQADFAQQAAREGLSRVGGVLGYYSPTTNRILMYDAASSGGFDWTTNAETIIHEAAHQTAFNTGVHSRFAESPRWVVEGLGTMFEARGVWQSRSYPHQRDRINRGRLQAFRAYAGRRPPDAIAQLVSSDRMFSSDPDGAYAEAWTLSFFLIESEPKKYQQYLAKTAELPNFAAYRPPQRLKDFTDVFGGDLKLLDARLQRFVSGLK